MSVPLEKGSATSPASSVFCRICHDKSPQSGLIAPCNCHGSITHVHKSCLDHWLTESQSHHCELCGTNFTCSQESPSFLQFIRRFPRPFLTDLFLFLFLTPMATVAILLCLRGGITQFSWQNYVESFCLFSLGSFLSGVYFAWIGLTCKNHYKSFTDWRLSYPNLKLVWPQHRPGYGRASSRLPFTISGPINLTNANTGDAEEGEGYSSDEDVFTSHCPMSTTCGNNNHCQTPQRGRGDIRLRSANSPSAIV